MNDLNVLFLTVGSYCQRQVATCSPACRLVDAADLMRQRGISSLVVCTDGNPVGILTDRDLRNKVVARGLDPAALTVAEVMNSPLVTISEHDYLFEALHRISRHKIHRLVVTAPSGQLAGIITDSDILRIQTFSPQQLLREIEEAAGIAELKELHQRVQGLVERMVGSGIRIRDMVRLIAHLNDRIAIRLIDLLRMERFAGLTERFAFFVLGSEGRGEQTLTTDQDNALVYADDCSPADVRQLEEFSTALIDGLIAIGIPSCPGGIMAKNELWRHSLVQWRTVLDQWFSTPTPQNILKVSMFSDLRMVSGDPALERSLKMHVAGRLAENELYLGHMTSNLLRFAVPLGWFGRIKTGRGAEAGRVDLKKAGIFAITEGVKILSLGSGVQETGTFERIEKLVQLEVIDRQGADDLTASFDALVSFRLRSQLEALRNGQPLDNTISLDKLNRIELTRLRSALEGVRSFQERLKLRYSLGQAM